MSCPSQSEYQPCNSKFLLIISWTREFIRSKKLYGSVRCRLLFFLLWVRPRPKGAGTSQPSSQLVPTRKKLKTKNRKNHPSDDFCFFCPTGHLIFFQTLKTPNSRTFLSGLVPRPKNLMPPHSGSAT